MNKCLIVLAFLCLAIKAGSALKCYQCVSCGDPFSSDQGTEVDCSSVVGGYCAKIVVDKGDVSRLCAPLTLVPTKAGLNGRELNDIEMHLCNTGDFCNGSGRLFDISKKMMLLPVFLILVISMFSR
ncbi:hypothetical protein B7P43_G01556 [Cryptotermes secundus]|uniref:Protein quiver n=2 Tax=Cryptotermes secundus TaxID=105785 RepID=A0A2J7PF20_9NEOP|nr:hypothetical protein B7P43_G01556 [Cryptotermes secundus]